MRFVRFLLAAIVVTVACSGGGNDVLHMDGADLTEDEWRDAIVTEFDKRPVSERTLACGLIERSSIDEFAQIAGGFGGGDGTYRGYGEPKPGQQAEPESRERAYEILKDVCREKYATASSPQGTAAPTGSPNASELIVEQTALIYLPDQSGGNFHHVMVLIRNPTDRVALGVTGQVSISKSGALVSSINPTSINILPGSKGVLLESVSLPEPMPSAEVSVRLALREFRRGPSTSPVTGSRLALQPDRVRGCEITGVVSNTFTMQKDNLQIRAVGFVDGKLVTGDFTYLDLVFPGQDATFRMLLVSPALCPTQPTQLELLPNLGEDKIFNP
jgi:hypothetical protein